MVTRHKGIAAEGKFSAACFKWVNKIIEFVKVAKEMDRIGICDIEIKIEKLKSLKLTTEALLGAKAQDGSHMVFRRLRALAEVEREMDKLSSGKSLEYSDTFSEYSVDFELETISQSFDQMSD